MHLSAVGMIERTEEIPNAGTFDVIICGGGPAGVGAAIAAGRSGVKTLLVERLGQLGGTGTGAGVVNWCDSDGGPVFDELFRRCAEFGKAEFRYNPDHFRKPGRARFDTEAIKSLSLKMVLDAGVEVLFLTFAESAWMDEDTVRGVFTVNKGGRSLYQCKIVIDATADGDIAASAGAEFLKGDPDDGRLQHCNFRYWIVNVDDERFEEGKPDVEELKRLLRQAQEDGELHPPRNLFQPPAEHFPMSSVSNRLDINNWELENIDPTDPVAVSRTLAHCQVAAFELIQFCRKNLPGYENCEIRKFPDFLGTRESRRIVGQYILTRDDVLAAKKFEDGIARAWFYMDLHDSPPGTTLPHSPEFKKAHRPPDDDWYEIPYRCLVPRDIRGLLIAGRCISCDREAHGSLRIMPTCMFTGTSAGSAAALAVAEGALPHELAGARVREKVMDDPSVLSR